jgi:hypothetical protein
VPLRYRGSPSLGPLLLLLGGRLSRKPAPESEGERLCSVFYGDIIDKEKASSEIEYFFLSLFASELGLVGSRPCRDEQGRARDTQIR